MTLRPAIFLDRDGTLMEEVHYCADPALVRLIPGTAEALRQLNAHGFLCVIITNQSGIGRGLLTEAQYHAVQTELLRQLGTQQLEENLELRNSGEESGSQTALLRSSNQNTERSDDALRSPEAQRGDKTGKAEEMEFRHEANAVPSLNSQLSTLNPPSPPLIAASYFCPDAPPTPSPRRKPEPGMVLEAARDLGIDLARSWFVGDKAADIACGARAGTRTILVQTGYGAQTANALLESSPDFIVKDIAAAAEVMLQPC